MEFISLFIFYALAALMVGASLFFLQQYMFPEPTYMQQRLNQLKARHLEEESVYGEGVLGMSRLLKGSQYANEKIGKMLEKYSFTAQLQRTLRQAGMKTQVDKFITTFLLIPTGIGLVFSLLLVNPLPLFLGVMVFAVMVFMANMRRNKRFAKLTAQLPDALNLITSSLRAGHSFQSALGIVVSELPDPISTEFGQILSDINWGIPVKEALNKMATNLDSLPDIRMLVTCLVIQREAGGNLAEVLDKLGHTIRERFKLHGQIQALTGQSRLTGYVLGCAPIGLFTFLFLFMNDYVKPLITSDLGKLALVVAAVMQIIGFFVMKKIIEIRV